MVDRVELRSAGLPRPSSRRLAVRITPDALRQVRGGSPWVFDGSITDSGDKPGAPGDLAVVFDDRRRFAAIGLWDPTSPIRVKLLHRGAPRTIDDVFWRERLAESFARRDSLRDDPDTTAYRCVHGENDGFPGLVVDRYERTLVVKLYSAVWFPHLAAVVEALADVGDPERIVVRLARSVLAHPPVVDGVTVWGTPPEGPVVFRERGLALEADVVHGNKTGHFIDQRDNRALVRAAAAGARVLDVFSSTGGFSVSAAAGGASSVHLVDVSAGAIAAAERNLALNRHIRAVRDCEVRTTVGDAFEVLRELERHDSGVHRGRRTDRHRFDMVIIDPPAFAQNERSVPAAERAYARLTRSGLAVLEPGGLLVQASCSSRVSDEAFFRIVHDAAASMRIELHELRRTGHPIDHPIGFEQGAYLKAVFART